MTRTLAGLVLLAAAEPARFAYDEPQMGTRFRVVVYADDQRKADAAARAAYARFAELNRIMSDYLSTSELTRLCDRSKAATGEPVRVSEELFAVLARAREVSELSGGAFDVTVGPLMQLWRHARRTQQLPPADELADARRRLGWRHVELNAADRTVRLAVPGMRLDLGGIAKGYAADEGLRVLRGHGIARALVAAGGDVAAGDPPPGKAGWSVDIAPLTASSPRRTLRLANAAVSTSGDSQQFVEIGGVRYSHVLDPRTGLGLTGRRAVTVVALRGLDSDPLSKVASVLPPAEAVALLAKVPGVGVRVVTADAEGREKEVTSPGFAERLAE